MINCNMKQQITIKECYHRCPFFQTTMDGMECGHPFWKDKGAYDNMIITHENSKGRVPDKCPLLKEALTVTYELNVEGRLQGLLDEMEGLLADGNVMAATTAMGRGIRHNVGLDIEMLRMMMQDEGFCNMNVQIRTSFIWQIRQYKDKLPDWKDFVEGLKQTLIREKGIEEADRLTKELR